jgi:hypothetical protein
MWRALAFVLALGAAPAMAAEDPVTAATALMTASTQLVDRVPGGLSIWSPEMQVLWEAVPAEQREQFVSDPSLATPEFTVAKESDTAARLSGSFTDAQGQAQEILVDLVLVEDAWTIADVASGDGTSRLSATLSAAAAP